MDSSKLADRLRGILKSPASPDRSTLTRQPASSLERVLGGVWQDEGQHRSFVVERRIEPGERVGGTPVGELAAREAGAAGCMPVFMPLRGGPVDRPPASPAAAPPFVFFDLETTGLSGGAGTYAFLVGFGGFDAGGAFVTRQHVLISHADERAMLEVVACELARAGALVSFNGKSFDAPLLETRYLFHRLEWPGSRIPHFDALHTARRFWGDQSAGCSLVTLEHQVLGARRVDDVAGFEIPARYFQFLRSGDAQPLAAVLEHNRLDLLSLAALTVRLLHLAAAGPEEVRDGREALALGCLYERAGLDGRAAACFDIALLMDESLAIRLESHRRLACLARRARRFDEAAARWRHVLEVPGCPPHVRRQANEALAIHHEHRVRDLAAATTFALRSLEVDRRPAWSDAVQHRLARLQRKMKRTDEPGLLAY
jgi:DNA polymerase III epsilon subunit-like protein